MNLRVRFRNPWFWVGLVGVVLTAMGVDGASLTTWGAVVDAAKALIHNPYMIWSVVLALIGVFVDPTTVGVGDSDQAMNYLNPKK